VAVARQSGFAGELRHQPIVGDLRWSGQLGKRYILLERVQDMARDFDKVVHDQEDDYCFDAVNRSYNPHFFVGLENELDISDVLRRGFEIDSSELHGIKSLAVEQPL
jgi:hypothetical protein